MLHQIKANNIDYDYGIDTKEYLKIKSIRRSINFI